MMATVRPTLVLLALVLVVLAGDAVITPMRAAQGAAARPAVSDGIMCATR
jgi:hypothetical protein